MKEQDIYDRIDIKLKEKDTTRKQMCIDLNIPYSTLTSFYQKRSGNITLSTIRKIAEYLGCSMDFLVRGENMNCYNNNIMYNGNIDTIHIEGNGIRELTEIESELIKICSKLSTKEKTSLLSFAYDLLNKKD